MTDLKYSGEWFLPESNVKLSGRLAIDGENKIISLELYGEQYLDGSSVFINKPERDKRYRSKEHNHSYETQHIVILGTTRTLITLFNCQWDGTEEIGENTYLIKYQAKFAFFDAHIRSLADLHIESGTFIYPYLSSWFDGFKSMNKLDYASPNEFKLMDEDEKDDPVSIPVTDNLRLVFFDQINRHMKEFGVHHETKFQKYLNLEYTEPASFQNLLMDAAHFKRLLEFSHGKPLRNKLLKIKIRTDKLLNYNRPSYNPKEVDTIHLDVANFTLHKGEDVFKHTQHQNYMLFSAWNLDVKELKDVIQKWFINESMSSIYDFYLDSNNWFNHSDAQLSPVMFKNRFLNIVQGIEAYHREVLGRKTEQKNSDQENENQLRKAEFDLKKNLILESLEKGSELKEWFNSHFKYKRFIEKDMGLENMLRSVMSQFKENLNQIFGKSQVLDFFPRYASTIRNRLSHGNNHKEIPGKELPIFFHAGQIILAMCIMFSLDIKDIPEKITSYDLFARHISQIRNTELQFR